MQIRQLTREETLWLDTKLEEHDTAYLPKGHGGEIRIGVEVDGRLIAGLDGQITVGSIFYLSSIFVEEAYRGKGIGSMLIKEMEMKAAELGARIVRLDSFSWQGTEFYQRQGYEVVGSYEVDTGLEENFFMKRLKTERP